MKSKDRIMYQGVGRTQRCSQEDHVPNCSHFGYSGTYLSEHAKECEGKGLTGPCTCNPSAREKTGAEMTHPWITQKPQQKEHRLKTVPNLWDDIDIGKKTADIRFNDRNYAVGDRLVFVRGTDNNPHLTLHRVVSHILSGEKWGLKEGYVMLSMTNCTCATHG